jgi:cytochrome c biogenesis protein CcmG, thiol:disulfide interchange protein DsbE
VNEDGGSTGVSSEYSTRLANREPNVRIVPTERMGARSRPLLALTALAVAVVLCGGCGNDDGSGSGGSHPDYAKALAGSPPPLAALHEQANELLPGGTEAYEGRIDDLRGYPVVVNFWASWCGPCRFEFPVLQKLSARYGKKVAFLGVNSEDSEDAAATYLREEPVPYPSYSDPGKDILDSAGATFGGLPDTAFYDRAGKLLYLKQGPYSENSELEADVRHYALGSG